ncbi:transporter substrate-binding domain-containing protein [Falsochrobactrum sp. TDYN1]|uniref:Transporter substrate-binding domain-containing protein n=1 Tax=Falsochrobactrum tianjinense TaxID=2706015 RepID=A0A949PP98_9HYPH|nr:transporter substrate-binding domain-containing protein [Falsochrobactrum sp. TDYN1]MBV2143546.1 transporter substrate-binding domain-containing protein [Falsochrobactrum sp. TDYN1]
MGIKAFLASLTVAAALLAPAVAQADKLQDILDEGKIRVGILLDVPPWGMTDASGKPTGLDVEVAQLLAEELSVELDIVQVTGTNRIPNLLSDQTDIIIAAMGATSERAQQIMFSQPYTAVQLGVFGSPEIGLSEDISVLDGHTIAVARGTTLDLWLTDNVTSGTTLARFDDVPGAMAAYLAGQADMFAENSAIISNLRTDRPEIEIAPVFEIRQSPAHIGVTMGEHNLLQWVNTFVFTNVINGKLPALQEKWFATKRGQLPPL